MTDPLTWSISLGRVAGTRVRVHVLLLFFAVNKLLEAAWAKDRAGGVAATLGWLALLMLVLALKALAQGVMADRVGVDRDEVRLWPLGHLGGPGLTLAERSPGALVVAVAGMATNFGLAIATAAGLALAHVGMVFNPFGIGGTGGAPMIAGKAVEVFTGAWWIGWFGYLNWVLFVANLVPALPLDGGRIFRPILASRSKDGLIGPWTAHSCAAILGLIGLVRWVYLQKPGGPEVLALAVMIELLVRAEASQALEDGGFFDDGMFGYDFSQGYTSLDAGAATVRPPREGALKRWRRRRSDLRRRRREAAELAEEQRMDAILEKLHREGRAALSDEEQRFLVRVSARYRKRVQGH